MINFRYHLVSLMAVFLSLTLGIALGSTVVKQGVLDVLRHRATTVKQEADKIDQQNKLLTRQLAENDQFERAGAVPAVKDSLTTTKVVLLAMRGVDAATVHDEIMLLQAAGSESPAIVWLEPKWTLANDGDRAALRSALDTTVDDADLLTAGLGVLARRLPETADKATAPDAFARLVSAGFVSVDRVGTADKSNLVGYPSGATEVIAVVGRGTAVDTGAFVATFVSTLATQVAAVSLPLVVSERDTDPKLFPQAGTAMQLVLDDTVLSAKVSTVDSLASVEGQVATVWAAAKLRDGAVGHYGRGPGSTAPFPALQ